MDTVFKEFPISLEYVVYFISTCVLLLSIVILEFKAGLAFLIFISGLVAVFLSLLTCWDLIAIGITKHRIWGIVLAIVTVFLFLGLIFDFIQAL